MEEESKNLWGKGQKEVQIVEWQDERTAREKKTSKIEKEAIEIKCIYVVRCWGHAKYYSKDV